MYTVKACYTSTSQHGVIIRVCVSDFSMKPKPYNAPLPPVPPPSFLSRTVRKKVVEVTANLPLLHWTTLSHVGGTVFEVCPRSSLTRVCVFAADTYSVTAAASSMRDPSLGAHSPLVRRTLRRFRAEAAAAAMKYWLIGKRHTLAF